MFFISTQKPQPHLPAWRLRPLAAACMLLSLSAVIAHVPAAAADAIERSVARNYDVPAGPLGATLNRIAREAGIVLTVDAAIVSGRNSAAVRGNYLPQQALQQALQGTGLTLITTAIGSYSLQKEVAHQDHAPTLPQVHVTAVAGNLTEGSDSYTTRALSLGKTNASLRETPHSVTVITKQRMEDQGFSDLNDVLKNTPGIEVFSTDSERVAYYARGHEIDNIQTDGSVSFSPAGSNGQYVSTDSAVLDHVEVLRGGAGLMRGAGSPSGAINLVRKKPTAEFAANAAVTVGSWDTYRAEADISNPLNEAGTLRGRVVAVKDKRGHFQKGRSSDKEVFYGVIEADLTPKTLFSAGFEFNHLETTGAWGNLLARPDGSPIQVPRETFLGASWNSWDRINRQTFLSLEHRLDNEWLVKASASFMQVALTGDGFVQTNKAFNAIDPSKIDFNLRQCRYDGDTSRQSSWDVFASGPFNFLGRTHEAVIGANGSRIYNSNSRCSTTQTIATRVDPLTWDPYGIPKPVLNPVTAGPYTSDVTTQQGVYGTLRFNVSDAWKVIGGARAIWWNNEPAVKANAYSVKGEVTPYLGTIFDLNKNLSLYASYADVFTPQRAFDVNGKLLDPITGRNLEAGIKGEFYDKKLNVSAAIFRLNQSGKALDDVDSPDPCLPYYTGAPCKVGNGDIQSQGIETEVSGQLAPGWQMSGGYTYLQTKYLKDTVSNTGNVFRSTSPRHLLRVFSTYRLPGDLNKWTFGGGVTTQSDISVSSATARAHQSGYTLASAFAGYRFTDKTTLQLNIDNLFDKTYFDKIGITGSPYYYGTPRTFMLTLRTAY